MVAWLQASIHQKNLRIDALSASIQTIMQAAKLSGVEERPASQGPRHSPQVVAQLCDESTEDSDIALSSSRISTNNVGPADPTCSTLIEGFRGSPGPGETSGALLHGLEEHSATEHFSIADSDSDF
jgi:hypothetical protein